MNWIAFLLSLAGYFFYTVCNLFYLIIYYYFLPFSVTYLVFKFGPTQLSTASFSEDFFREHVYKNNSV